MAVSVLHDPLPWVIPIGPERVPDPVGPIRIFSGIFQFGTGRKSASLLLGTTRYEFWELLTAKFLRI